MTKIISTMLAVFFVLFAHDAPFAQETRPRQVIKSEFGPNVQAYLDYLKEELTVTDLRESQREVSPEYVRHNFNRVSALRQFAIKIARETETDFIPEMEAVTLREFRTLFSDAPPKIADLRAGETYAGYRYLGAVRNRETFYIFARLDPFEEDAARKKSAPLESVNAAAPPPKQTVSADAAKAENKNLLKQPNH
jgi:hypothetical protein